MKIIIRSAVEDDYSAVIKLFGIFVENQERYKSLDNDSYFSVLKDPSAYIKLAILDNQIIGFITYSTRTVVRYPSPILEVDELFVDTNYRNKGAGKLLMKYVINFAKKQNYTYVFLGSSKQRHLAHEFYKSIGFDDLGYHFRYKL